MRRFLQSQKGSSSPFSTLILLLLTFLTGTRIALRSIQKLTAYVGEYEDKPGRIASIFVEDNTLMLKLAGAPVGFPLLAESGTQFFHPAQDIMIVFIKNANGQVVEVTLRLNGREFHAKKIK